MKQVKVKIETIVETMIGDKPVNEVLGDIADIIIDIKRKLV